jgi:hypothetical protein
MNEAVAATPNKRALRKSTRNPCMTAFAYSLQVLTEPAKVSCDGTQLEVARGKVFCKAACRNKMPIPL